MNEVPASADKRDMPIIEKITFSGELKVTEPAERVGYKGRLFWARAGNLIYSKIRIKQGSVTIVPPGAGDVAVSSEYPVYEIETNVVEPSYLALVLRCSAFQKMLDGLSHGGSTKTRIHPNQFEALEIPFPLLTAQQAIVERWRVAQDAADAAEREAEEVERLAKRDFLHGLGLKSSDETKPRKCIAASWRNMDRWGVMSNQRSASGLRLEDGTYPVVEGAECIAEVIHGCSASPSPIPTTLSVLKISAVTRGVLDVRESKFAPDNVKFRKLYSLHQGDVLLCRTNGTLAYVGQSALVERDTADLIFPDKIIRVRMRKNILPAYFWKLLQTPPLRSQIESAARTAVGNYAIGGRDLWQLRLPLPPLDIQQSLVTAIEDGCKHAAALRAEARRLKAQAAVETEAAILGRA